MVSANGAVETLTLAPDFIKGGRAMSSVFDLLDWKTEIEPDVPDSTPAPDNLKREVEFKHVDLADVQVFRDLNLRAQAGKTLALVGPSGCGKSSVIALGFKSQPCCNPRKAGKVAEEERGRTSTEVRRRCCSCL
uniref:ABC transporter domain-containing protein n=1 Tax=Nelumbo nucifera TaxID=4432 RepID=A0A822YF36_NELNU|nr:TPA_asm: hypothetical protein HUJ06_009614 [Nelumbo nucifera]